MANQAGDDASRGWLSTRRLKRIVAVSAALPAFVLAARLLTDNLGANPIAELMNRLGWWALLFLAASLACTPLKLIFGWHWPPRLRKTLGLAAFFYATLHLLTYVVLDQFFDFATIWEDLVKRKFILVGFLAFLVLVPLAITSRKASLRKLGPARWNRLHRLVYLAATLAVVHFVWRVKSDLTEPLLFATVIGFGFAVRLLARLRRPSAVQPG